MFVLALISIVGANFGGFGGKDAQIVNFNCLHTQKALPCIKTRRLSHQPSKSMQYCSLWSVGRKKKCKYINKLFSLYFTYVGRLS